MLGATHSVDMVTSLREDYGRMEVAVLDVSLLPNRIKSVVIGDRLFSLLIVVEGREEFVPDHEMDLDDNIGGEGNEDKKGDNTSNKNNAKMQQASKGDKGSQSTPQNSSNADEKRIDGIKVKVPSDVDTTAMKISNYPSSYSNYELPNACTNARRNISGTEGELGNVREMMCFSVTTHNLRHLHSCHLGAVRGGSSQCMSTLLIEQRDSRCDRT